MTNWTTLIFNKLRSWYGLEADASEAETHAAMEKDTAIQALETRADTLQKEIDSLQARIVAYESQVVSLQKDIKGHLFQIEALKKEPADKPTSADTPPAPVSQPKSRAYMEDPVTQKARARFKTA